MRLAALIDNAAKIARWHRSRHAEPDRAAFLADWQRFEEQRGDQFTTLELHVMIAYVLASLGYDGEDWAIPGFRAVVYHVPANQRGLWGGGNSFDRTDGEDVPC